MADKIRKVNYYYTTVANRPGQGIKVLDALKRARVNLLAYSGFPSGRVAQLDFVPESGPALLRAARQAGIKLSAKKAAFLIEGADRVGAVANILQKLAKARINVTAMDAVCTKGRRYGAILWVKPGDVNKASKVLRAK